MGVSGSGKSTLGKALADRLKIPFIEADDFHSEENRAKMRQGIPLTDADREPWLKAIATHLASLSTPTVLACSALKNSYRATLAARTRILPILLDPPVLTIRQRLETRGGHFFPATLLDSQLEILERPINGATFVTDQPVETLLLEIVPYCLHHLKHP
jgi:carbohydrate kinase (thermoresistant glucokinase family)